MTSTFDIYHDLFIEAPIEKVFDAITDPDHLVNWWPLKCAGKAQLHEEYNFYFGPEYDWYGKIIQYDYPRHFYVKMTKSDIDWDATSFGFDLEELGDKVHVRFLHKGWPTCNAHYRRSSYCWAILLHGLKKYVEKGVIIPFSERE